MDWTLIFTAIGAVATVISTIIAVRAKNESKRILEQKKNIVEILKIKEICGFQIVGIIPVF